MAIVSLCAIPESDAGLPSGASWAFNAAQLASAFFAKLFVIAWCCEPDATATAAVTSARATATSAAARIDLRGMVTSCLGICARLGSGPNADLTRLVRRGETLVERCRRLELLDSPGQMPANRGLVERERLGHLADRLPRGGKTGDALLGRRKLRELHARRQPALLD